MVEQNNNLLKQGKNGFVVTGTLKEKHLEAGLNQKQVQIVRGYVVVEFKDGDKLNNLRLDTYSAQFTNAGKPNNYYNGLVTVMNDFKDKDTYGEHEADRIQVNGDVAYNVYSGNDGVVHENNRFRANTFTRIDKSAQVSDGAQAEVEAYVIGYQEDTDDEGVATDMLNVNGFTVDFRGQANKLIGLKVPTSMNMPNFIPENSKVDLLFKMNQYAEIKEQPANVGGFGNFVQIVNTQSWTRNLEVLGGGQTEPVDPEVIQAGVASIRQQVEDAQQPKPQTNPQVQGFMNLNPGFNNQLNQASQGARQPYQPQQAPQSAPVIPINGLATNGVPVAAGTAPTAPQNGQTHNAVDPFAGNQTTSMPDGF